MSGRQPAQPGVNTLARPVLSSDLAKWIAEESIIDLQPLGTSPIGAFLRAITHQREPILLVCTDMASPSFRQSEGAPNLPLSPLPRTGRVFFYDDFESTVLSWTATGVGTPLIARTTTYPNLFRGGGGLSCTTSNAGNDTSYAYRMFPIPPQGKARMSLEIWFRSPVDAHIGNIYFNPTLYDGANRYEAEMRYLVSTTQWQIVPKSTGIFTNAGLQKFFTSDTNTWNWLRYIWDWSVGTTGKRLRIYCNEQSFDLTGIDNGLVATADTSNPHIFIQFGLQNDNTANAASAWFDDVSLAIEENLV